MMRFTMLATAGAIAIGFASGPVSAADQFTTLNGVKAAPMSTAELAAVKGMDHHFFVAGVRHDTNKQQDSLSCTDPATCPVIIPMNQMTISFPQFNPDGTPTGAVTTRLAAPSYNGLKHACVNSLTNGGSITGPGFLC